MSSDHAKLVRRVFQDPPSPSIHWRGVESPVRHVGAEIEALSGARIRVCKDRVEAVLHRPHQHTHELDKHGLMDLREFAARAGVTPSLCEAGSG